MNEENDTTKQQSEWRQRELGVFWKREYKNREGTYLAGHIVVPGEFGEEKKIKVVLFSNRDKPSEKAPDFKLYRSKEYNPDSGSDAQTQAVEQTVEASTGADESSNEEIL